MHLHHSKLKQLHGLGYLHLQQWKVSFGSAIPCRFVQTVSNHAIHYNIDVMTSALAFQYTTVDMYGPDNAVIACEGISVAYWGVSSETIVSRPVRAQQRLSSYGLI